MDLYFRFGSALALVVVISLLGIGLEKRNLQLRREVTRQHFRMEVLRDAHAGLRLKTQQLGAPARMIDALESGALQLVQPAMPDSNGPRTMPLLRWQRPEPQTR